MSPDSSHLELGLEEVDRKYEVIEKIAEGGMGAIFKARHRLLDEVRVIKTIRPQFQDDPELRERFLREAKLATQLHHQYIARIHDLEVGEEGTACIVMEFVEGINLIDRMRREPALEQEEVLELADQILDALGYLHHRKIVHRDISPDNIMLARDVNRRTQVKLIDLGIAKPLDDGTGFQTKKAMFIGKLRYASPEQLGGGSPSESGEPPAIDGRSDLYSLGIVLYELLTGVYPIRGSDESSVLAGQLFHPPLAFDVSDPKGTLSAPLRGVMMRALAKTADERFQSADEFREALREAAAAADSAQPTPAAAPTAPVDPLAATRLASSEDQPTVAPLDPTVLSAAETEQPPTAVVEGEPAPATAVAAEPPPTAVVETEPAAPRSRKALWASLAALILVLAAVGGVRLWSNKPAEEPTAPQVHELAGIDFGNYKALVIGNDDYLHMPDLETATRDARDVAEVLEDRYGFDIELLLNADRSTIVNALYALTSGAGPTDNLLIYYAGHGSLRAPGGGGAWLAVDAQPMEDTNWVNTKYDVKMALDQSNARHVLVIADSCYSSSLATSPLEAPLAATGEQTLSARDRVLAALRQPTRLVLAAGELKPIPDSAGNGHSIFSGALLEILEANQALLEVGDLFERLEPRVQEASQQLGAVQRPQLGTLDGTPPSDAGFFFLPEQEQEQVSRAVGPAERADRTPLG